MKKISLRHKILAALFSVSLAGYAALAYAQTRINLNQLQQQATNTVLGNFAAGTGNVTAQNIASCASAASALRWTTNTGFNCNTAIDAATLGSATFAAPGAIGGGTPAAGSFTTLSATGQITSTLAIGTPPFVITSTTNVPNLNASSLNGATFAAPGAIGGGTPAAGSFTTLSATGQITSTLAPGTAPFVVASTTQVANLMASDSAALNGATFAAPGAIGGGTPAAGSFTTLSASTMLTATGNNQSYLIQPATTTAGAYGRYTNASGSLYFGIDDSTGANFGTAGNYGTLIYRPAATQFAISRTGTIDLLIGSTGIVSMPQGLNNTVIGATTPAAGTFYTLAASSGVSPALTVSGATTGNTYNQFSNTGGIFIYGVESSVGGTLAGGTTAYATVINSSSATPIILATTNAARMVISAAGAIQFVTGYGAGTITSDASGNLTSVSDETLKTNIRPFNKGLREILQINPILHGYNKQSGLDTIKKDYPGFSAQNVKTVIPETVGDNGQGKLTLSHAGLIAALVNSIKEQQKEIDTMKIKLANIESLTAKITALEQHNHNKKFTRASLH